MFLNVLNVPVPEITKRMSTFHILTLPKLYEAAKADSVDV